MSPSATLVRGVSPPMLRRLLALVLALGAFGAATGAASAGAGSTFVFSGHGWGHGIGMSQYGALGYAENGLSYTAILAHYYPGTELGAAPATRIRVLLVDGKKALTVSSELPFSVKDGAGQIHQLAAGSYSFGPRLRLPLDGVTRTALAGPLLFTPGRSALELGGNPYRGTLTVTSDGKALQAIDTLGLEGYLYGVVPSEMPSFWDPEALRAQAVAARSYALAARTTIGAPFDVYGDTRSQAYGGIGVERPSTNAAVDTTAKEVLLYGGQVATTYFYSTSGGQTAAIQDVWPTATPMPYLVSVPDPYDTLSPYHDWGPVLFTGAKLGQLLKAPGLVLDLLTTPNPSGRVGSVVVTGAKGQITLAASDVRRALGLRSTWFSVGVLSLTPPAAPLPYGSQVQLSGVVRGLSDPVQLEQRQAPAAWQPVPGAVSPGLDGTFTVTAQPTATTDYRLTAGKVAAAPVRVQVAPVVTLQATATPSSALTGTVQPTALAGSTVDLERQDGTTWTSVATATVNTDGTFSAPLALQPGSYRTVVPAALGLAAGVSPTLVVQTA